MDPARRIEPASAVYIRPSAPPRRYWAAVVVGTAGVIGALLTANLDPLRGNSRGSKYPEAGGSRQASAGRSAGTVDADTSLPTEFTSAPSILTSDRNATGVRGMDMPATDRDSARARPASRQPTDTDTARRGTEAATQTTAGRSMGEELDLSGWWTLNNRVEFTSYQAFNNLRLGYRLRLEQHGSRISGTGYKWMENGTILPVSRRTPISLEGIRNGRRLDLNFSERGARRTSRGTFVMEVAADGTLYGMFVSDAANSQGTSLGSRASATPK